ncbi:PREDICTED: coiled-coil domain-containing protein C16orf93 homolog [Priapulus caudatus]|nr:PREDICTED: coiled-coil domain-containing protein C16orf93 homolog [Priapulus caudatus]
MDHGFSDVQTAAFFTVVKRLHEMCTSTPFDNIEECFQYFRELMLCHSVQRPPWSIALFTAQQVQSMAEHVVHTYFKHFLLYKYAFTPKLTMDISLKYSDSMEKDSVEETSAKDSDSGENEQGVIDAPLAV